MRHLLILATMMMITQHLSSQVHNNPGLNIDGAIKMQVKVLDGLLLIPEVATNPVAVSLKKESDVVKEYLVGLIDNEENMLDSLKDYTIDAAWQFNFRETNLEQELSKYISQIKKLQIGKNEIEKISNYIDRKSKIKPTDQDEKVTINTFPKASIIKFYKIQYIDIVNAEIFFLKDVILTKE